MAYFIHETAIVGMGFRYLQGCIESVDPSKYGPPHLPSELYVGPFSIIGLNCRIGEKVIIDSYCKIDPGAVIGYNTLITYRATVGTGAVIGNDCIIGGSISEHTKVGNNCRVFGKLIHKHTDSTISWDHHQVSEPGVTVHDNSFIGHDTTLIGGIEIGPNAYICSGAVITRSVPAYHIGFGTNQIVHYSKWKGELASNPLFEK